MAEGKNRTLVLLGVVGGVVSLLTVLGGVLMLVFATKGDLTEAKSDLVEKIHHVDGATVGNASRGELRDWRIKSVTVKVDNLAVVQQRHGANLERLLLRFRVPLVDEASYTLKPLPPKPGVTDADSDQPQ